MRTREVNEINMALTVQRVINNHKETWLGNLGFKTHVETMISLLAIIKEHQQNAEVKTKGVTLDKANAAEYAIEMGLELAGNAYIYAKKEKSETLKKKFRFPKRDLDHVQGVVALSRLNDLYGNLESVLEKLNGNVTVEELEAFQAAIKNFESQMVNPRAIIIVREKSNDIIAETVKKLKSNFEDMDGLIYKFKKTDFEREYILARIVIDHGKGGGKKENNDKPKDDELKDDDGPKDKEPEA